MTLHLVRWAAGVQSVSHLKSIHAAKTAEWGELYTYTRMVPRRTDELLDGGSLYWVIKGAIAVRQPLLWIDERRDGDGAPICALGLGEHVLVNGAPRRAFQGWRYLAPEDAPPDLPPGTEVEDMPEGMKNDLRRLGLL